MLKGRHLISPNDFSIEEMNLVFDLADNIIKNTGSWVESCKGKILSTLFFEPSTRTRLSFEAAMHRLGGGVMGFAEPSSSSAAKGESLVDTVRTVAAYSDVIVMRNPKEGSALLASKYSDVPFINAGDGGHDHPTQTLTDLLTIRSTKGKLDNLTIGFCGDLKFGRTVHSLVKGMKRYTNNKFVFISPSELEVPDYLTTDNNIESESLEKMLPELDILYMTRVQKERFFNEEDYLRLKDTYILDAEKMKLAKKDLIVLHPLPRVNEISMEVDSDPRAMYFQQAKFGMYVRMALIASVLGVNR